MCPVLLGGVWEPIVKWRTHMFTIFDRLVIGAGDDLGWPLFLCCHLHLRLASRRCISSSCRFTSASRRSISSSRRFTSASRCSILASVPPCHAAYWATANSFSFSSFGSCWPAAPCRINSSPEYRCFSGRRRRPSVFYFAMSS